MVINGGIEMKKIIGILALTAVLALTACTGSKNNTKDVDETSENIAVTDLLGREVEVPAEVSSIIAPVSYTHLDVYKRQAQWSGVFISTWQDTWERRSWNLSLIHI